ncbi:MAG: PEP-CTERM sorting domain-containing protein [Chthoniobacteraceae bacterium]
MKTSHLLALFPLIGSVAFGATTASFDGGADTPIFLNQFGDAPGPSIQPIDGNPGGYLELTPAINGQNNFATFDLSDPGENFTASTFTFQFRFDALGAGGADGMSFNYYPTALYGTTGGFGAPLFTPEDPAAFGVLGFGFDTWGNGGLDANANSADYSEISLFFDGALISRVDDTRLLPTFLDLKDGAWHTVNGAVDTAGASVTMDVDGNPIFSNVAVAGLVPAEARVGFAGRTGGANERTSIDNVDVRFVPEPGVIGALAVGSLVLLRRRRR